MKTGIVLMHGGAMGKWLWKYIEPLLKFPFITPERYDPASLLTPGKISAESCVDYAVKCAEESGFDRMLLVAHSGSGVLVPAITERLQGKVKHILYASASIPPQGKNALDMIPLAPRLLNMLMLALMPNGINMPKKSLEKMIRQVFCNGCSEEIIQYVLSCKLSVEPPAVAYYRVDRLRMPKTPCTYLVTLRDKCATVKEQKKMAQEVGCNAVEMDSCHMSMLDKPAEFAGLVNSLAGTC